MTEATPESKFLLKSRLFILGLLVMAWGLLEWAGTLPSLPPWAVAAIGVAVQWLRSVTVQRVHVITDRSNDGTPPPPPPVRTGMLTGIVLASLAFATVGCAPATCQRLELVRQDHPTAPAPARRYLFRCGEKEVSVDVEEPPACLEQCFDGGNGTGAPSNGEEGTADDDQ